MCVEFRSDEIATKAEKKDREYLIHCNLLYFVCSVVQRHLPCQPKTLINKIKLPSQLCHICVMCICAHNGCDFFAIAQPSNGHRTDIPLLVRHVYITYIYDKLLLPCHFVNPSLHCWRHFLSSYPNTSVPMKSLNIGTVSMPLSNKHTN